VVTLLAVQRFGHAVAASLDLTQRRAAVPGCRVAIVALLGPGGSGGRERTIDEARSEERRVGEGGTARRGPSGVAGLGGALGACTAARQLAVVAAAVEVVRVAVVALFAVDGLDAAVAAGLDLTERGAAVP